MAAVPWQKSFLRVTAGLTAVGIFVIFIGVAVTYSQPAGPDAESPSTLSIAAIPMVMLAISALLVLYLGVLVERETVLEKLPKFTPCRMTIVVVLLVLLCPVRHLVFALLLIICGMGLVVSILDSFDLGTSARLVVAAAGDGILCIVQGEVLREAGAAGDVLAAQFGLFLLAGVGGGFLPGLAFVAARRKFPKVCRNAAIGYAAMAVHSAVLLMQAIGTEMRFFLDGGGYIFDSPQCLYSTIDSPLSLVLNFLQSFATADEYQGPSGPAAPCPEDAEFVSSDPSIVPLVQMRSCTEMPLIALFFFLLLGARGVEESGAFSGDRACTEKLVCWQMLSGKVSAPHILDSFSYAQVLGISMFDPLLSSGSTCESRSIFVEARQRGSDASKMEALPTNREGTRIKSGYEGEEPEHPDASEAVASMQMYVAVGVAMVGAAMFGFDQGNFGNVQAFETFRKEWCIGRYGDEESCSAEGSLDNDAWNDGFVTWGATLITFGAAAGAILLGPSLTNRLGRRPCIQIGGFICFLGCLMASYLSSHSIWMFFSGRFITGFGVGVSCFALPLYNAEISTPAIRGATGSLFQLNVVVGCFISCLITFLDKDWYTGMLLPGLAGAVLTLGGFFIPESPRFVMEKMLHKESEAKAYAAGTRYLKRIRAGDVTAEADEIMQQIKDEMDIEHVSFLGLFKERNLRKRVFIACCLAICQQATGVNAFLGYAATLFKECGIESPIMFNSIFNSIMIFGCIAGLLLVDSKYGGRRCQLLAATTIMGPPLILAGLALQFSWPGIITMACVVIYGVGFQFAWGTIPWIYPAATLQQ
ncbi:MST4 [Symbiodinium sp. CCMP2456]|nr:MST4 [Symbiodinium sp. CCMP2456]